MDRLLLLANCDRALNPGNVGLSHTGTDLADFLLHAGQDSIQLFEGQDLTLLEIDSSPCHILQILQVALLLPGPRPVTSFCFTLVQVITEEYSKVCRCCLLFQQFSFCLDQPSNLVGRSIASQRSPPSSKVFPGWRTPAEHEMATLFPCTRYRVCQSSFWFSGRTQKTTSRHSGRRYLQRQTGLCCAG